MHTSKLEKLVSWTLRVGVLASASLLVLGIIGLIFQPSMMPPTIPVLNLTEFLEAIATGASSFSYPNLFLYAGIVVLVLTPLARVLITLFGFAFQKDWTFVVFSLIVLLIITFSISLGIG